LRDSGLLDDGGVFPALDRLTRLAARELKTTRARISLVDADREVSASCGGPAGPGPRDTPLSHSLCGRVVADGTPLLIRDVRADERVRDSPAAGDGVIAYAGFPLRTPDGHVLGCFGVIDDRPRSWTPEELLLLEDLAGAAETDIALRLAAGESTAAVARMRSVLDSAQDAFVSIDGIGAVAAWNDAAVQLFGYTAAEALGRPVADLIIPDRFQAAHAAGLARVRDGGASTFAGQRIELTATNRDGAEFPVEVTMQVQRADDDVVVHAFLHNISHRAAAQRDLENQRTFLHELLDSLDAGVAATDAGGRLTLFNRAMRDIHDADAAPIDIDAWAGAYHLFGPDGRTVLDPEEIPLVRAHAGEHVNGQELVICTPGVSAHRFLVNSRPVDTPDGRRLGAVAVLHDITERHRHETLQRVQLAVAQVLADASSAEKAATGILAAVATALDWACGEFWQVDGASEAISRVGSWTAPGHDLSAMTGDEPFVVPRGRGLAGIVWGTAAELWVPEVADDDRTVGRREQARRAGLHTAIGIPVRSDDRVLGVLLFFTTTVDEPDPDLMGMLDGVCAHLGRHIERRRAEELALALAAARRDFDRVIAQVNDYLWTVELLADDSVRSVYASPDGSGVFGERAPTDTHLPVLTAARVHPDDLPLFTGFHADLTAGRPGDVEVRLVGGDGVTRWVWTRAVPRVEAGRRFVDGISTNITERHHLAEQRERLLADQQEQNRQLRDLDRMKDELVALVSHELRNPLAIIRSHSEMLLEDSGPSTEERRLAAVIDTHSAHMQNLVDDLLDMARSDAGQLRIDPQPVSLTRLVADSVHAQRPAAHAKDLTVTTDLPDHLPVQGDPVRLRQVFDNLLSNATKYTPPGGMVSVTAGRRSIHGSDITAPDPETEAAIVVTITDNGIGIPAEHYPRLFERFSRASNAQTRGIKGTGLGLAISKAIVHAHHGAINARPAGPTGTTFTVTLPATADDA
jgi:PAS domain S-box-containing protein